MKPFNEHLALIAECTRENRAALLRHILAVNQWRDKYPHLMRADNEMAALALALLDGLMGNW
jgi:hypothetical protein